MLGLCGRIIRDADVSQGLCDAWIQQVVFGLAAERGVEPIEVLRSQETFMRGLIFSTAWARAQFPPDAIEDKIAEAQALLVIFESPK